MHRTIVVGRGLFGSAAARHLSVLQDGVLLIGPDEPADRAGHDGVFASHYDEGRMTRVCDADPHWALTAARSIARYPEIEASSGIRFYSPSGYLGIGAADTEVYRLAAEQGRALGAELDRPDAGEMRRRFPFLALADDALGLYERHPAGHISPRAMVRAQTTLARQQGVALVDSYATSVRLRAGGVEIESADGEVHRAERALIAAGAYTEASGLAGRRLDLRVLARTVVLARIDDAVAAALDGMPTLGHAPSGAYILPPIRYPDGQAYLKIGIGSPKDARLRTSAELAAWFKGPGSDRNRRDFRAFLTALIPPLGACRHWHADTCVVAQTPSGLPVIDFVDADRIAVAVGGNGKGAKSADDWGLAAAGLVAGREWQHPVPRALLSLPKSA